MIYHKLAHGIQDWSICAYCSMHISCIWFIIKHNMGYETTLNIKYLFCIMQLGKRIVEEEPRRRRPRKKYKPQSKNMGEAMKSMPWQTEYKDVVSITSIVAKVLKFNLLVLFYYISCISMLIYVVSLL